MNKEQIILQDPDVQKKELKNKDSSSNSKPSDKKLSSNESSGQKDQAPKIKHKKSAVNRRRHY